MFEFGDFKLDVEAVRLIKNNQNIDLEPQVFNTLVLLVQNRHRVVSKQELLDEIWQGRTVTEYVITRIIYELRKILDGENDAGSAIRTVRGKGYQFEQTVNTANHSNTI
ncbi:MAG: winged helix-turn-helix domain-containing protein, partial [Marinicella sp.]